MLHRSRAFVSEAGENVTILTLDDRPDYSELEQRLRADGTLVDGIRLLNIWDWLRDTTITPGATNVIPAEPLDPHDADSIETHNGVTLSRTRELGGSAAAVDRFRHDGSLLLTDRRVYDGRSVVFYDVDGRPIKAWKSSWALYRYWLDRLTDGRRSFLIVDSKTAARFVHSYRRDHVVTLHLLHGSHRRRGSAEQVSASRRETFEHAADYDAIVTLTERQSEDYLADGATPQRMFVVPNGRAVSDRTPERRHVPGRGVMLASLTGRKRVAHALDAVARARQDVPDVTLDVYGEGPKHADLAKRINDKRISDAVRLHGFERHADARFADADFTLLTSTSEGLPLVLVESMAAGCIPIAYDICYGPADIITDGSDGFLVPEGSIDGLAERIVRLRSMPARTLRAMRRRARRTAKRYSDGAVTRRWGRVMELALEGKRGVDDADAPALVRLRHGAGRLKRRMQRLLGL